jgi:hypothetical protein
MDYKYDFELLSKMLNDPPRDQISSLFHGFEYITAGKFCRKYVAVNTQNGLNRIMENEANISAYQNITETNA